MEHAVTTRRLEPEHWQTYFDRLGRGLPAMRVELHVDAPALGDQVVFRDAELLGVSYDPRDGALEVATPGGAHRIDAPRAVHVEESPEALEALQVTDGEGRQHILTLRRAPSLPSE